jgi:hypothetical protein
VQASPAVDPGLPRRWRNLGIALEQRFERTGDPADRDAALEARRQAAGP